MIKSIQRKVVLTAMEEMPEKNGQSKAEASFAAPQPSLSEQALESVSSDSLAANADMPPEMMAYLRMKKEEFENGYASIFYQQIVKEINAFNEKLDDEHEVGLQLVSFGETVRFNIESIGFQNPYLIEFYGHLNDRSPIQLVQHVSQINFVLIKLPRENPDLPKKTIGFDFDGEALSGKSATEGA
ncbi:MAG: DUF6173 family protein [Eubacteriaceae bacterium]|jgi:hypothetical protein|nr:DUF6173 family protein [Eubacteriaceae bacterium]